MNDSKIDFSSLDPSRDSARWEARIARIGMLALARRQNRPTVLTLLTAWSRPMLAIAASVAFVGWATLFAFSPKQPIVTQDPAVAITSWALRDEVPNPETVIALLGGPSVDR